VSRLDTIVAHAESLGLTPYARGRRWAVYLGDAAEVLAKLPAGSVHCCVTSPPYYGLRDYEVQDVQIGLEPSIADYLQRLMAVLDQVQRVLSPAGSLWLNIGDSYVHRKLPDRVPKGSLAGIPARVQVGLTERGWVVHNVVAWVKRRAAPEPVTRRRLANTWEPVLWATRSARYYADVWELTPTWSAVQSGDLFTGASGNVLTVYGGRRPDVWTIDIAPRPDGHFASFPLELPMRAIRMTCPSRVCSRCGHASARIVQPSDEYRRVLGKAWHDHSLDAVAGNRPGERHKVERAAYVTSGWSSCACDAPWDTGVVLDPFAGSGTTLVAAILLGREAVGIDIVPKYAEMSARRLVELEQQQELALEVTGVG